MKIIVNNKETEVREGCTVEQFTQILDQSAVSSCAIVKGTQVIRKTDWATTVLKEGDSLTIIQATCGG